MSGYISQYPRLSLICILILFSNIRVFSQKDTLPDFTVVISEGIIQISWQNPFKNVAQMNIQRSKESNKNFSTIHSLPNPSVKYYQYQDKTAKTDSGYYRVFILFEGSNYQFTKAIRPIRYSEFINMNTLKTENAPKLPIQSDSVKISIPAPTVNTVEKKTDSLRLISLKEKYSTYPKYLRNILLRNIPPPPSIETDKKWIPSKYVFTGADGNIMIAIPDAAKKKYAITILKEEGRPLFRIPKITQPTFTLDKTTFLKSGWYYFELRESGNIVERNKFLITRDY